jgi:hypothetical protein
MTVASNITVYLVALAFFGIGGNGDQITDKVLVLHTHSSPFFSQFSFLLNYRFNRISWLCTVVGACSSTVGTVPGVVDLQMHSTGTSNYTSVFIEPGSAYCSSTFS